MKSPVPVLEPTFPLLRSAGQRETERETERERGREGETDRQTDRQTDSQTDRQKSFSGYMSARVFSEIKTEWTAIISITFSCYASDGLQSSSER